MQSDTQGSEPSPSIYITDDVRTYVLQRKRDFRVSITDDVRTYVLQRKRDFRVSTSCSGAILLPTSVKPPKSTDLKIPVGDYTIYVSKYQARYIDSVHKGMIPIFYDDF